MADVETTDEQPEKVPWDQTWAERNGGWEHTDSLGRWVGLRYSRFHGLMISTGSSTVYVDEAEPALRAWLAAHLT